MLESLMKKWNVGKKDLVVILCVFAITGCTTAYLSKSITGWAGFTANTHWSLKLMLRLAVLIFGYQAILLTVAFLLGQFQFFWRFEKKMLARIGLIKVNKQTSQPLKTGLMASNTASKPFRLAIFASGTGSNAKKIIEYFQTSALARVSLLVCNKTGAGVVTIAEKEGIPTLLINKEKFFGGDAYLPELKAAGIDMIVLAGFLWKIPTPLIAAFPQRIINIHPALLPKFGGKGMYGQYVHQAVLGAGEIETGITIHYVDEHYDNGDIIFQTACPVLEGDKPGDIALRIQKLEHAHYPAVLEQLLTRIQQQKISEI